MQSVRKYQRFVARWLEQARATIDPRLKAFLAEMAQGWERVVEDVRSQRVKQASRSAVQDPGD
jgi:hypothetical protein